jgi:hypothetical protein
MVSFQPGGKSLLERADRLVPRRLISDDTILAGDPAPLEVVNAIFDYYEHKSPEPSVHEQEKLLEP